MLTRMIMGYEFPDDYSGFFSRPFSGDLCHLAWVQVSLAHACWHGSVQNDAIYPVVTVVRF